MPDYRLATRRAANQFGVDPGILLRLIQQESGFNPNARSPAGAQGIAQFMPATAKAYGVNLNDNRVTDDLEGAARYLRANLDKYGSYTKALSVYNSGRSEGYKSIPETANYVRSILGGRSPSAPSSRAPGTTSISAQVPQQGSSFDPGPQSLSTLAGLIGQQAQPPVQVPQAPHAVIQSPVVSAQPSVDSGVGGLLDAIRTPSQELPTTGQQGSTSVSVKGPTATAASTGTVKVAPNANRPGVGLTPGIQRVLRTVASVAGPLTVGTGTRHNRLTVDGNVSDHYSGNAADLPTTPGEQNIRLGRQALIALGVPHGQAQKAMGGIYNIPYGQHRRIQVIFNTNAGGNHHDHVHVGVSGR